jgi:hypothetical protein
LHSFPARILYNNVVAPIDEYPADYYATDDWTPRAWNWSGGATKAPRSRSFYMAYNAVHGPGQAGGPGPYEGRHEPAGT